jgi:hypothetical protein
MSAAMSIFVDVPLEHPEDAAALLEMLAYTGWRHVPCHQQSYVAQRMSRFVTDRKNGAAFRADPLVAGADHVTRIRHQRGRHGSVDKAPTAHLAPLSVPAFSLPRSQPSDRQ